MKITSQLIAQFQPQIADGRAAAVESYYAHKLEVGHKAEMARCVVEIKRMPRGLLLTVWPQSGDKDHPITHRNISRSIWLRERCSLSNRCEA